MPGQAVPGDVRTVHLLIIVLPWCLILALYKYVVSIKFKDLSIIKYYENS